MTYCKLVDPRTLPRHNALRIRGIYFLFQGDTVVYVGQSADIQSRLSVHMSDENKEFDSYAYFEFPYGDLDMQEGDYIMEYQPFLNSTMPKGSRWKSQAQLKTILNTKALPIKRWVKKNLIRPVNGFYNVADFGGFDEKAKS